MVIVFLNPREFMFIKLSWEDAQHLSIYENFEHLMFKQKYFKEFENLSVEKMTLSTALGFEPRSFDCRSTALTTELHNSTN